MRTALPKLGSRPINMQTRIVTSEGEHWEPRIPGHMAHLVFDAPKKCHKPPPSEADFVGLRRGNLVAVGFLNRKPNSKSIWLMRCDCGKYTIRLIKGWVKRLDAHDECDACKVTRSIANHQNGKEKIKNFKRAKFAQSLRDEGMTEGQIQAVLDYKLPCEDIDWLKQALQALSIH